MEIKGTEVYITKIEPQKKDPKRRSLFVEGRFKAGVYYKVVEELDIEIGKVWDDALETAVEREESYFKGLKKAADLLYRSSKTKKQLIRKLIEKEFLEDVAQRIADKLEGRGFINDLHYSEQFIEMRCHKYGGYRLRQELRLKGVDDATIEEAMAQVEQPAEYQRALTVGQKRIRQYASDPREKVYQKMTGYLSRKGFGYDVVKKVVNEILDNK